MKIARSLITAVVSLAAAVDIYPGAVSPYSLNRHRHAVLDVPSPPANIEVKAVEKKTDDPDKTCTNKYNQFIYCYRQQCQDAACKAQCWTTYCTDIPADDTDNCNNARDLCRRNSPESSMPTVKPTPAPSVSSTFTTSPATGLCPTPTAPSTRTPRSTPPASCKECYKHEQACSPKCHHVDNRTLCYTKCHCEQCQYVVCKTDCGYDDCMWDGGASPFGRTFHCKMEWFRRR